jgi:hypothetical protein
MGVSRHLRGRRAYALFACVLWLVGVEVLPNLHLAFHDASAPHEHTATATVVIVSYATVDHRHADGTVHSHAASLEDLPQLERSPAPPRARPRHRDRGQLAIERPAETHAATGLAHHALALHEPPPPLLDPVAPLPIGTDVVFALHGRPAIAFAGSALARGPPAS